MPPSGNGHPNNETTILYIDATTFLVTVLAVVTAVLTHLNANNINVGGIGINDNQVHPGTTNYHNIPNLKPKDSKRKFREGAKGNN